MTISESKRAYDKAYRLAHREEIAAKNRIYNETHQEQRKAWFLAHRKERTASARLRYAADPERARASSIDWRAGHPEWVRARAELVRTTRHGVSAEWIDEMYDAQEGCCAVCDQPMAVKATNVDHNHATGVARALLCRSCNVRLGVVENLEFMDAANSYLEVHS